MDLTCPQMYMDVTCDTLGKLPESAHDALSSRGDWQCCSLVLAGGPHGAEPLPTHSGLCGQNGPAAVGAMDQEVRYSSTAPPVLMDTRPWAPLRRWRSRNKSGEVPSASQARTISRNEDFLQEMASQACLWGVTAKKRATEVSALMWHTLSPEKAAHKQLPACRCHVQGHGADTKHCCTGDATSAMPAVARGAPLGHTRPGDNLGETRVLCRVALWTQSKYHSSTAKLEETSAEDATQ